MIRRPLVLAAVPLLVLLAACDLSVPHIEVARGSEPEVIDADWFEVPVTFTLRNQGDPIDGEFKVAVRYGYEALPGALPYVASFVVEDAGGLAVRPERPDVNGEAWYWFVDGMAADSTAEVTVRARVHYTKYLCPATGGCDDVHIQVEADSCSGEEFAEAYCRVFEDDGDAADGLEEGNNLSPLLTVRRPRT